MSLIMIWGIRWGGGLLDASFGFYLRSIPKARPTQKR